MKAETINNNIIKNPEIEKLNQEINLLFNKAQEIKIKEISEIKKYSNYVTELLRFVKLQEELIIKRKITCEGAKESIKEYIKDYYVKEQ